MPGLRCFAGVSVVEEVEKKNVKLNKHKKSKKKSARTCGNCYVTIRTYRPIFIYLLGVLILES